MPGHDEPGKESAPWYLPAKRMKLYRWRLQQRKQFASDAAWGDLDGDLVPEVALGRLVTVADGQLRVAVLRIE